MPSTSPAGWVSRGRHGALKRRRSWATVSGCPTCSDAPSAAESPGWLEAVAGGTLAPLQSDRSTWRVWHVRAEAQRLVRSAGASILVSERAVGALVAQVLHRRSVSSRWSARLTTGS